MLESVGNKLLSKESLDLKKGTSYKLIDLSNLDDKEYIISLTGQNGKSLMRKMYLE
jgi:hypothetical protein